MAKEHKKTNGIGTHENSGRRWGDFTCSCHKKVGGGEGVEKQILSKPPRDEAKSFP